MIRAGITGVHGIVPPTVLSNKDLEKMVETNDEWIESRTGIKEEEFLTALVWEQVTLHYPQFLSS